MLHEKMNNVHKNLEMILPHVDPTRAEVIRHCCRNLSSLADQVQCMEGQFVAQAAPQSAGCMMDRPPFPHEMVVRHG